ncbi:hypothetical protein CKA32_001869 [Geitlerinema sp. FC II]|nr:hypothetical protein CKA32_001869 [Geitlerinema sp. FC II]
MTVRNLPGEGERGRRGEGEKLAVRERSIGLTIYTRFFKSRTLQRVTVKVTAFRLSREIPKGCGFWLN